MKQKNNETVENRTISNKYFSDAISMDEFGYEALSETGSWHKKFKNAFLVMRTTKMKTTSHL